MKAHLSNLIKSYILNMKVGLDLLFKRNKHIEVPVVEEDIPLKQIRRLSDFLRTSVALYDVNVYSSDNSLKSCFTYGDIYDLIQVAKDMNSALMLDERFDFDKWNSLREPDIIRSIFIGRKATFPDPKEMLSELRWSTFKLAQGYELRKMDVSLGKYTRHNLSCAEFILKDLHCFFVELYDDYRQSWSRFELDQLRGR